MSAYENSYEIHFIKCLSSVVDFNAINLSSEFRPYTFILIPITSLKHFDISALLATDVGISFIYPHPKITSQILSTSSKDKSAYSGSVKTRSAICCAIGVFSVPAVG